MKNDDVDIAIVGAGPVGCVLALALARSGIRTALIEARVPRPWSEEQMDLRVFALSRASQNILHRLGAWDRIETTRACAYRAMQVWEAGGGGRVEFHAEDVDERDLGHIVEGTLLGDSLLARVRATTDIAWYCPAVVQRLEIDDDAARLSLEDGLRLEAKLVIGADGAHSRVREWAGIEARESDYGQSALVAHLRPDRDHGRIARQVFHVDGPLAMLPLSDGRVSIVWSMKPEHAERLLGLDDAAFAHAVTESSEKVLGTLTLESENASFPLKRLHAINYVAPRVALAGDAAHVVHPLAGQGMNLGLLDAAALSEVILDARRDNRDVDDYLVLRRYERWRHAENLAMQSAFGGFNQLFGLEGPGTRSMRGFGMQLFNQFGPAKRLATRIALGLAGDLPELAKPVA